MSHLIVVHLQYGFSIMNNFLYDPHNIILNQEHIKCSICDVADIPRTVWIELLYTYCICYVESGGGQSTEFFFTFALAFCHN